MNWLMMVMRTLQLVPVIVAGIQHIHGEAPGATKKQMAMDALSLAYGSASAILPQDQAAIDAATELTSNLIDNTVAVFKQAGIFQSGGAVAAPKPAPKPAPAPVAAAPNVAAAPKPIAIAAAAPAAPTLADLAAVNHD